MRRPKTDQGNIGMDPSRQVSFARAVIMTFRPKKMRLLEWLPDTVISTRGPHSGKALYLTFDDGPNPAHTPALLDLLKRHGAKATFFLIGREVERHPSLVWRIVEDGH